LLSICGQVNNKAQAVSHVGSWVWYIQSNRLEWSDEMYRIFGLEKEAFSADLINVVGNFIHPEDRAKVEESNLSVINHKVPIPLEYRVVRPDKTVRVVWAEAGELILDEAGKPAILTGIVQDITERKLVEDALRTSEEKFRLHFVNVFDVIYSLDPDFRVTSVSPSVERTLGYQPKEFIGSKFLDLNVLAPECLEKAIADTTRVLGGERVTAEYSFITKKGSRLYGEVSAAPLYSAEGQIIGLISVARDITERKEMEDALRQSEEHFRSLYENATVGLYRTTPDGRILMVNPTALRMLGYDSLEELSERDLEKSGFESSYPRKEFRHNLEEQGVITGLESAWIKKDGTTIFVRESAKAVRDEKGQVLYYDGTFEDITERKKAEEELLREKAFSDSVINSLPTTFFMFDPQGRLLRWNAKFLELSGLTEEEAKHMRATDFIAEADRETILNVVQKVFAEGHCEIEAFGISKKGNPVPYHFTASRMISDDQMYLIGAGIDITERKQAEQTLRENEEKYRQLFELESDAIVLVDNETGRILEANAAASALYDYSRDELLQKKNTDLSAEPEETRRITVQGEEWVPVRWHRKKNGLVFPVEITGRHFTWHDRKVHIAAIRDITERLRTSKALERIITSARCLLWYAHVTYNGSYYDWHFQLSNEDSARRFLPVAVEQGQTYTDAWICSKLDEEKPQLERDYREALENDRPNYRHEFRCRLADGSERWLFEDVQITSIRENEWDFVGVCTDITERKRAEEALRKSETQLANAMNIAHLACWEYDVQKDEFTLNDQLYSIFRTSAEEIGGYKMTSAEHAKRFIHPDDLAIVATEVKKALETTDPYYNRKLEHRAIYADGETGFFSVRFLIMKDRVGRTVRTFGVTQDITERKRAEESLRRLGTAVDQTIEGIAVTDMNGVMLFANPAWTQMHGYSVKEIIGKNLSIFHTHQQLQEEVLPFNKEVIESGFFQGEVGHLKKDGTTFPTLMGISLLKDEAGRPEGIIGVAIDISEQKRSQEALQESEKKYRSVIENIQDVFYRSDRSGHLIMCSPSGAKMLGYTSPGEMLGLPLESFWQNPSERESALAMIREKGMISDYEAMFARKDGFAFPVSINAHFYHDEDGQILGTEGMIRDITERKRVQEKLRESEERSNLAIEGTGVGLWDWNIQTGALVLNERWAGIIGYTLKELSPITIQTWNKLCHTEDIIASEAILKKHFSGDLEHYECEARMKHKNGNWIWILDRGKVVAWDNNGNPLRMTGTHMDITARKLAEEQIRASLKEKEILLQELYHRTKNNMQVIRSMIKLQSYSLKDEYARKIFNDMDNRINAMSLVHQKLYQSDNLSSISMQSYIRDLASLLMESYQAKNKVSIDLKIQDIAAVIDLAVPCGLLITELISNSMKHAFPGNRSGNIIVQFKRTRNGKLILRVSDNGVGFPPGLNFKKQGTLGMQMIQALGEHQLQGKVKFESKGGFCCKIQFSDSSYVPRV
jgi:PAS domain S-box-containing protein